MSHCTLRKALSDIQPEVYKSALQSRPDALGRMLRRARDCAGLTLALLVMLAPLALLAWIGAALGQNPAKLRLVATSVLATLFLLCVVYHCMELVMAVPWQDRSFPVLLASSDACHLLAACGHGLSLSTTTAIHAALLWVTWWRGWQQGAGESNTLFYAAVNTGLSVAMLLYGRSQPYGAFRAPTPSDCKWLQQRAQAPLVTPAPAVSAAPAVQDQSHQADYPVSATARAARLSFAQIFGMQDIKDKLLAAGQHIVSSRTGDSDDPPSNGILLHGAPGNGKTCFAEALAGELQVPIVTLTYGDVASKWLGEMPRTISRTFAYAKAHAPCVFFIDEIDSFLRSRESASCTSEDLKIANTLLTEMVSLRQHRVVLVGATNNLESLDSAAVREGRFDIKVEVTAPDEPARIGILRASGAKYAAAAIPVDEVALLAVAKRWRGFSVSRLVAVCKALPACGGERQISQIGFDEWVAALRLVQGSGNRPAPDSKRLNDMVFERRTKEALRAVARRLSDAHRIETMGGTLPTGILLYGHSGTGKTAAARALALECGWAFLTVSGPDLVADGDRLNRVYSQAMDLRPAIVFIDEADDVLADRRFATVPDLVNRLLALMDGADRKITDVVFIAATNRPSEQLDPAVLRGGRFTEKIEFDLPPASEILRFINSWVRSRNVRLERAVGARDLALMIGSRTIADIDGILQTALNCAVCRVEGSEHAVLTRSDICRALKVVCGVDSFLVAVDD